MLIHRLDYINKFRVWIAVSEQLTLMLGSYSICKCYTTYVAGHNAIKSKHVWDMYYLITNKGEHKWH